MSKEGFFIKTPKGLVYASDGDREALEYVRIGAVVKMSYSRVNVRNYKRLKLWFGLASLVAKTINSKGTLDGEMTQDDVSDYIKIGLGHFELVKYPDGSETKKPKSIAYGKLTEPEFASLLDRAINVVKTNLLPGVEDKDLRRELEDITGMGE